MKLSARNVLKGTVENIELGPVHAEVTVEVSPGLHMSSTITRKSAEDLALAVGKPVYVVVKASNVILGVD